MKMAKWVLRDDGSKVHIIKSKQQPSNFKTMYESDKLVFDLAYNDQNRMIGYQLDYKKPYNKTSLFNCFSVIYNEKSVPSGLEVLFEDQVLRLMAYKHKNKIDDYVLWGRWREETMLGDI